MCITPAGRDRSFRVKKCFPVFIRAFPALTLSGPWCKKQHPVKNRSGRFFRNGFKPNTASPPYIKKAPLFPGGIQKSKYSYYVLVEGLIMHIHVHYPCGARRSIASKNASCFYSGFPCPHPFRAMVQKTAPC